MSELRQAINNTIDSLRNLNAWEFPGSQIIGITLTRRAYEALYRDLHTAANQDADMTALTSMTLNGYRYRGVEFTFKDHHG